MAVFLAGLSFEEIKQTFALSDLTATLESILHSLDSLLKFSKFEFMLMDFPTFVLELLGGGFHELVEAVCACCFQYFINFLVIICSFHFLVLLTLFSLLF